MGKKNWVRIVAIVIAVLMLLGLLLPALMLSVSAETIADKRNQYDSLGKKLTSLKKEIASIKDEQKQQQSEKANAEEQLVIVKQQIDIMLDVISQKEEQITVKQEEVDQKRIDIEKTDELFRKRLKAMYITRGSGALSTILAANSFSEFLTAADAMQRISVADTQLLQKFAADKAALQLQEEALEAQLLDLEEEKGLLQESQAGYAAAWQVANNTIDQLEAEKQANEAEYEKISAEYNAAKVALEAAIAAATAGSNNPYVGGEFGWPVPGHYYISSPFGWRQLYGRADYHIGIDVATGGGASIYGKPIVASNDGWVKATVYGSTGYGIYTIIDHGGQNLTLYGHCSGLTVSVGQAVVKGSTIGYVGSTGNSTGPHLHFEIRKGGTAVDPKPLLIG